MTGRQTIHLCLEGLPAPIAVERRLKVIVDHLARILVGWPAVDAAELAHSAPFLSATGRRDRVLVERYDTRERRIEPTTTSAICTLVVELMAAYVDAAPKLGNLHAAAVELNGRLVVFPATNRSGKSTLVSAFAARGHRVFADDLLPVDLERLEGVASGCLPRVRLPLPKGAPKELLDYVEKRTVVTDGYYAYLSAGEGRDVAHGTRAPIGAIVLPDLEDGRGEAVLSPVEADEALLRVLMQDTKSDYSAEWTLTRYLTLAEQARIMKLTYGDIGAAIDCLTQAFADWPAQPEPTAPVGKPSVDQESRGRILRANGVPGTGPLYRRAANLEARVVGGSAFLIDLETENIHHLNSLGLGLWNLLEEPSDAEELAEIVAGAFPDTPRETIGTDVRALLADFAEAGLVEKA